MPQGPEQEIRFAIVMYGGVSLAIYMNGIAQELLRVVRATSLIPDAQLSGTELIYRKVGRLLHLDRVPGALSPDQQQTEETAGPVRSRVVVDILSGTSAGGINAVFLAKALTLGAQNMDALATMWKVEGDIGKLMNDAGSERKKYDSDDPPTSLLNSQRMYGKLCEALDAMDQTPRSGYAPMADEIDLFVTATDLHGLYKPVQLADSAPEERIHKMVFHFRTEAANVADLRDRISTNDFTADFNPMLGFAARCTSSFPAAFEPMKLEHVRRVRLDANLDSHIFRKFFKRYEQLNEPWDRTKTRPFADGGYLDNRPFSYPIETIARRDATIPVERRLLILDPFPEYSDQKTALGPLPDVSLVDNLIDAAMALPRYETIREDLERIQARNQVLIEVRDLMERIGPLHSCLATTIPANFSSLTLDELVERFGPTYRPYHHLRVIDTTRQIAKLVAALLPFNEESHEVIAIRRLVEIWRDSRYAAQPEAGQRSENEMLVSFDADFRLRRLNHIRMEIDCLLRQRRDAMDDLLQVQLAVRRSFARISHLNEQLKESQPVIDALDRLGQRLTREGLRTVMAAGAAQKQVAREVFGQMGSDIVDEVAKAIEAVLAAEFAKVRSSIFTALDAPGPGLGSDYREHLRTEYLKFPCRDAILYPIMRGTGADEAAQVQAFRIGPAEATLYPAAVSDMRDQKLAGIGLGAFAGFLSKRWRENDILWGRLDGAERILCALLPDPRDREQRNRLLSELRQTILAEQPEDMFLRAIAAWLREQFHGDAELSRRALVDLMTSADPDPLAEVLKQRLTPPALERFMTTYYRTPDGPSPKEQLQYLGRALRIFSAMLGELGPQNGVVGKLVGFLSLVGSLILSVLALVTGFGKLVARHVLLVAGLGALIVWLIGWVLPVGIFQLSTVPYNWAWALLFFGLAGVLEWLLSKRK
ncbi:MAG: patatin-like protein [Acidobacteria bacterium]|nr:patatin-like protein [Acidobacteriota bacterium]